MSDNPEIRKATHLEVKVPCDDCPLSTDRTAKLSCQHIWRHLVIGNMNPKGEVPFDTPERALALGAKVSFKSPDEVGRPSVQLFADEPPAHHGFIVAKIADN